MRSERLRLAYTVRARRLGRRWVVDVPGMPGIECSSKSLIELEGLTRSAMAGVLGLSTDAFDLIIER